MSIDFGGNPPPDPALEYLMMRGELQEAWDKHAEVAEFFQHPQKNCAVALLGGVATYRAYDREDGQEITTVEPCLIERSMGFDGFTQTFSRGSSFTAYSSPTCRPDVDPRMSERYAMDRLLLGRTEFTKEETSRQLDAYRRYLGLAPIPLDRMLMHGVTNYLRDRENPPQD